MLKKHDAAPLTKDFQGGAPLLMPFADQVYWIVREKIKWIPEERDKPATIEVEVPNGFVTDFASIPPYLKMLIQSIGRHGLPAIIHDWLYWHQPCSREMADHIFDRAMRDMVVDDTMRKLMWAGVRVFGGIAWANNASGKDNGDRRVLKTFPNDATVTWADWQQNSKVFI